MYSVTASLTRRVGVVEQTLKGNGNWTALWEYDQFFLHAKRGLHSCYNLKWSSQFPPPYVTFPCANRWKWQTVTNQEKNEDKAAFPSLSDGPLLCLSDSAATKKEHEWPLSLASSSEVAMHDCLTLADWVHAKWEVACSPVTAGSTKTGACESNEPIVPALRSITACI